MKVYIAGPMRGIAKYNYPAFNEAAKMLRANGHEVVNPAEVSSRYADPDTIANNAALLRLLMDYELELLRSCDAVCLLDGWLNSEGACAEVSFAVKLGKPTWGKDKHNWSAKCR